MFFNLKTTHGEPIEVFSVGQLNDDAGPDFFNAKIKIDDQLWVGNVELHIKASDWYKHNHDTDAAYNNVILHVVWEADADVIRTDHSIIPTLELKSFCPASTLSNFHKLFRNSQQRWINCANDLRLVDDFVVNNWLERLFFERLEKKSLEIQALLNKNKNDWESVLFLLLAKYFGTKVNADAFESMARSIKFSLIRKLQPKLHQLEALFFGQFMLLEQVIDDPYYLMLQKEYNYLKQKFHIDNLGVLPLKFFRIRPANFPTIRLAQLAMLNHNRKALFSDLLEATSLDEYYKIFQVTTSSYWETHYRFAKHSSAVSKVISKRFVDLLIINCVLPLKFSYAKVYSKSIQDELLNTMNAIKSEKNTIIEQFKSVRLFDNTALVSQSLIQLKTNYCDKNKCLQCAIGNALLQRN